MADLVITPAAVAIAGEVTTVAGVAGEVLERGDVVYLKTADTKYWRADNALAASAAPAGIVLTAASADGFVLIANTGIIKPGASMNVGEMYHVSANAGKLAPFGDLGSLDFVATVLRATSTTEAKLELRFTNVQIP